jgi:hypothetical protein
VGERERVPACDECGDGPPVAAHSKGACCRPLLSEAEADSAWGSALLEPAAGCAWRLSASPGSPMTASPPTRGPAVLARCPIRVRPAAPQQELDVEGEGWGWGEGDGFGPPIGRGGRSAPSSADMAFDGRGVP